MARCVDCKSSFKGRITEDGVHYRTWFCQTPKRKEISDPWRWHKCKRFAAKPQEAQP